MNPHALKYLGEFVPAETSKNKNKVKVYQDLKGQLHYSVPLGNITAPPIKPVVKTETDDEKTKYCDYPVEKADGTVTRVLKPSQRIKYPFFAMDVGDSFTIPVKPNEKHVIARRANVAAWSWKEKCGGDATFSLRSSENAVRVTRKA